MADVDILNLILKQEVAAEKRYATQVSSIASEEVKTVLKDLRAEEAAHIQQCVAQLKRLDSSFEFKPDDIEIETEGIIAEGQAIDDYDELIALIELDKQKEELAFSNYTGYSAEAQDPEIKVMLKAFIEDESDHKEKLLTLLNHFKTAKP